MGAERVREWRGQAGLGAAALLSWKILERRQPAPRCPPVVPPPEAAIAASLGSTADGKRVSIIGEAADAVVEVGREITVARGATE